MWWRRGNRLIQFEYEGIFEEILDQLGEMPLPPYITHKLKDRKRYLTRRCTPGMRAPRPPLRPGPAFYEGSCWKRSGKWA